MNNKLIVKLLTVGKPTASGKVYSREELVKASEKTNQRSGPNFGVIGEPDRGMIDLAQVAFIASDFQLVGEELMCTVKLLDTPCGKTLLRLMRSKHTNTVTFKVWGFGNLSENGSVGNYELGGCYAEIAK